MSALDPDERSLEDLLKTPVVGGASKFEQKITEAPSSVTVISSEEAKRYGHRTLADLLQSVQGFHVTYDRNYAFLGTRGINLGDFNSRILVLVDGHRINNNLTDGALVDTAFILDVDLIDRVEVIRGPGSVLYGNNAFFGVINVVTRQGKQLRGAEASAEYGSFDTYKGRFTYGTSLTNGILEGLQFLLSGTLYDSAGDERLFYEEFDTPQNNNGIARKLDNDFFGSFFGSVSYRDFTLQGAFIDRDKENPTAQFVGANGFNKAGLQTVDERSYVSLKYAHDFAEVIDVTAQVYYDRNDFSIGYPIEIPGVITNLSKEKATGEWWGTELQLNKRVWDRHIITLGAEYRDDFRQDRRVTTQGSETVVQRDQQSHGIYAQGDFAVLTNLHVNAGVRYDKYGDFDARANPRVAVIYHPFEKSTLKWIYGTGFRAPNFLELALSQPDELDPEEITTYEFVYEQEIGQHWRSSVSAFYNDMTDLIVFENGFTNFDATTKGIELALAGNWTTGLGGRVSYTLQETENRSTDSDFPDSPTHLFKLNVSAPLFRDKLFAGLEFHYTSSRETVFTTPTGERMAGKDAGAFGIVNFTLFSQNIIKNLEFSASVYNLLDKRYGDPATRFHQQDILERDGRTFRVKLTYRF